MKLEDLPKESGWYWILIDGYNSPTPCWYDYDDDVLEESCFLPAGMGDSSSMGIYYDDIVKVICEIEEPKI